MSGIKRIGVYLYYFLNQTLMHNTYQKSIQLMVCLCCVKRGIFFSRTLSVSVLVYIVQIMILFQPKYQYMYLCCICTCFLHLVVTVLFYFISCYKFFCFKWHRLILCHTLSRSAISLRYMYLEFNIRTSALIQKLQKYQRQIPGLTTMHTFKI